MEALTIEKAKTLKHGDEIFIINPPTNFTANLRGSLGQRWRVNGNVKLWKRSPDRVKIPIKHGLYQFAYLTEKNINKFQIET